MKTTTEKQTKNDEKAFYKMKERKQIETKLKYCTIILEDKELEFYFIFNLFKRHKTLNVNVQAICLA